MGAIDLHARASKDFEAKLAETQKLLIRAASEYGPLKQASSLGAEDVVITHLINSLELDIPVFVLETGALHGETLDLLERTRASSRTSIEVYRPVQEAVVHFVGREGKDPADAERQFARYRDFYQGDAVVKQPLFARS